MLLSETLSKKYPAAYFAPTAEDYSKRWSEAESFFKGITAKDGVRISDGTITLMNGARLDFFGLHRYDGVRGNKYKRVVIDEAAHAKNLEDAWTRAIRATLTDYKGDGYFLSTPNGSNYFKVLCENDGEEWAHFHAPTLSNPYIDPTEIEAARRDLPSVIYQQEYLAEFISLEGSRIKREWLKYAEPPAGATITLGVDLAISQRTDADYSAIVAVAKHGDNYYVCDVVKTRSTFNATLELIKQMANKWQPASITIEAVQYQAAMVQELVRTTSLPIVSAHPSKDKVTRFIPIEAKYEHGYVYHSLHLQRDFEDELLTFPNAQHDDCVDALVYAVNAHTNTFFAFAV